MLKRISFCTISCSFQRIPSCFILMIILPNTGFVCLLQVYLLNAFILGVIDLGQKCVTFKVLQDFCQIYSFTNTIFKGSLKTKSGYKYHRNMNASKTRFISKRDIFIDDKKTRIVFRHLKIKVLVNIRRTKTFNLHFHGSHDCNNMTNRIIANAAHSLSRWHVVALAAIRPNTCLFCGHSQALRTAPLLCLG